MPQTCETQHNQCAGSSNRLEGIALKSRACDARLEPSCPQSSQHSGALVARRSENKAIAFGSTTIKIRGALTDQTSLHEPALTRASAQPQKWVAELSSTSRSSGTCRLTSSSEVRYWTLCRLLCCSTRCGAQPRASTGTHRRLIFCPSGFRTE